MKLGRIAFATAMVLAVVGGATAFAAFGTGGKQTVNAGGTNSAENVVLGKGGTTFGIGSTSNAATDFDVAVVKLDKNGIPDSQFSGDGLQVTELGGFDGAQAGVATKSGGLVVAGVSDAELGQFQAALAAYEKNGSLDNSFSGDGKVILPFGGNPSFLNDIAVGKDGSYLVAGAIAGKMLVASITKKGKLDKGFGDGGSVKIGFEARSNATSLAVDRRGRVTVAGDTSGPGMGDPSSMAVARLTKNGKLDRSFSKDGKATVKFNNGSGANDMALFGDGRVVMAGTAGAPNPDATLAMLSPSGKPVKSFGKRGKVTAGLGPNISVNSVAVQKKSVLIGGSVQLATSDFMVARFSAKGKFDTGFGDNGLATADFDASADLATGIAVGQKSSVTAAGLGDGVFGFARWTKSGNPDD